MENGMDDALDRLLRDARPEAPAGLAGRLAAKARDPELGRILFWSDVAQVSRHALRWAAAAAIILVVGAAGALTIETPDANARTAALVDTRGREPVVELIAAEEELASLATLQTMGTR